MVPLYADPGQSSPRRAELFPMHGLGDAHGPTQARGVCRGTRFAHTVPLV